MGYQTVISGLNAVSIPEIVRTPIVTSEENRLEKLVEWLENEIEFQKHQAAEHKSGVFKNDITYARYDQAAIILGEVIKKIRGEAPYEPI